MDIQIRKQLEQLEYIKDKLEYIEYDEALGCYIEKQDGLPTGVAAWVNGAFYGFEQSAKAQAVPNTQALHDRLLVKSIREQVESHIPEVSVNDLFDKGWLAAMKCIQNNIDMLEAQESAK